MPEFPEVTALIDRRRVLRQDPLRLVIQQVEALLDDKQLTRVCECVSALTSRELELTMVGTDRTVSAPHPGRLLSETIEQVRSTKSRYAFLECSGAGSRGTTCLVTYGWARKERRQTLVLSLPWSLLPSIDKLLACVCDATGAIWAGWTPPGDDVVIENKLQRMPGHRWNLGDSAAADYDYLPPKLAELPIMEYQTLEEQTRYPARVHWLNYWSADTARGMGFPSATEDQRILQHCSRTPSGAWIVKLSEAPLDLEREDDVETLVWAYRRFKQVGKRASPDAHR